MPDDMDDSLTSGKKTMLLGKLEARFDALKDGQAEIKAAIEGIHNRIGHLEREISDLRTAQAVNKTKLGAIVAGIAVGVSAVMAMLSRLAVRLFD